MKNMSNLSLEVLISCMHQKDHTIIQRTNIQTDVVVINQCDENNREEFSFLNKKGEECHALFISTTERGLSKSRNLALQNSTADICLICDDDEILEDQYKCKILESWSLHSDCDIIAFEIRNAGKKYPKSKKKIGYFRALKLASWQLSFNRLKISNKNIKFDESLGSGVSKAGGEENKFIYDCLRSKLKACFIPITIGEMIEGESQWFHGFTKEYFYDRGIMTRKLMGRGFAFIYGVYYLIMKYPQYRDDLSFRQASQNLCKGLFS